MKRDPLELIRTETRATPEDVAALRERLGDLDPPEAPAANRRGWVLGATAIAAAAAIALALLPADPPPAPAPPVALAGPVSDGPSALGEAIHLLASGEGVVSGTPQDAVVDWAHGTLRVEVDPTADVELLVRTEEGEVRVVGTLFTVHRDVDGTRVDLERGHVRIRCTETDSGELVGHGTHTCRRLTPGMLLHQARNASTPDEVLDASTQGLARVDGDSPIAGELRYLQVQALRDLGRLDEAAAAAQEYVADEAAPRRAEVCRWLAEANLDCEDTNP